MAKSQKIVKVIPLHHKIETNSYNRFHGSLSIGCQDIALTNKWDHDSD